MSLYDADGNKTNNITDVYSMDNYSLTAYQERFKTYNIYIPENVEGTLNITGRLLFRPFNPGFILQHHPEFINNIPIFEISSISSTVTLN